ncbi:MAG TPA: hypothetical protein VMN39_12005 [Longimicrobiaceae bacterium]|nr:hypothetical protein [Longimicrobiaceae bacterium]
MSDYTNGGSTVGTVLKWIIIGILAIVVIKVGLTITGLVIGFGFFALFTVGPILLIGWLVLKVLRSFSNRTDSPVI